MSLCILPNVDIFPALAFDDDIFDVFEDIEGCLEHIHSPAQEDTMVFDDIQGCLNSICAAEQDEVPVFDDMEDYLEPIPEETMSPEEVTDDGSKLTLSLDVSNFKPEELNVNLDGRTLTIEGKQEIKENDSYGMRSFTRQWELPEDVDVEQVRSTLSEDGRLAVEASKTANLAISGRDIPIQRSITEK
ncbi:Hsp20/alpha crystallin family protein [Ancylostoma duodenale]|uniref:Hsp20/alpha crystallin family protein n=1 Tax=Ancylostoma duodenale TaxID=51022 RepID=A0A0C2D4C0_9BILA|nr:Hsp20/alpha crystallin family protein [Ancylostoma duodenale]